MLNLLEPSIDPSPSQHVLGGVGREESDVLRAAQPLLCQKNAETERRCADLCEIHSRAPAYDGHSGLAKFQGVSARQCEHL